MTPQNEAQRREHFGEWVSKEAPMLMYEHKILAWSNLAYKAAYSLQQEKIDKQQVRINELEKGVEVLNYALNQSSDRETSLVERLLKLEEKHFNTKEENKSLRSDLNTIVKTLKHSDGSFLLYHNPIQGIITRHKLDAHDEQGVKE